MNAKISRQPDELATSSVASELLRRFRERLGPNTRTAYLADLRALARFMRTDSPTDAITFLLAQRHGDANAVLLDHVIDMERRGIASTTIHRRISSVASLVRLARATGASTWTPEVPLPRSERLQDRSGPPLERVAAMLALAALRRDHKGLRDIAIVSLLAYHGLRRDSVVSLDREHVVRDNRAIMVATKGRRARTSVAVSGPAWLALTRWLDWRGWPDGPVFVSLDRHSHGTRLSGRSVARIVGALGAELGLEVRPHGLRHSAITTIVRRKGLAYAQQFAGHADPRTTSRYVDEGAEMQREAADELERALAGAS
jgi:integrase/recombinase XerC